MSVTAELNGVQKKLGSLKKDVQRFVSLGLEPAEIEQLQARNKDLAKQLEQVQAGCVLANQEKEAYRTTMERMLEAQEGSFTTMDNFSDQAGGADEASMRDKAKGLINSHKLKVGKASAKFKQAASKQASKLRKAGEQAREQARKASAAAAARRGGGTGGGGGGGGEAAEAGGGGAGGD